MEPSGAGAFLTSGEAYDTFMGRYSAPLAIAFADAAGITPGQSVLDVGCGPGALTAVLSDRLGPAAVAAVDPSPPFVAACSTRCPGVDVQVGGAEAIPFPDGRFDAVLSQLVLHFVADPQRAGREFRRVLRPGGVAAACVWDFDEEMQMLRHFWDAAIALDPAARDLDEGACYALCRPEALTALFRRAGLSAVEIRAIEVPTVFRDFDDFWLPFLSDQAPDYARTLPDDHRAALRERIKAGLPIEADGSIHLTARAWAVRGVR